MGKIDELIKVLCPDGVEYVKLGNCSKIERGERVTKKQLIENGQYPVISGGVTPMGFIDKFNREKNTITVSQYGTAGYVDFQKQRFWANDICYSVYPKNGLINKYLWYAIKTKQNFLYQIRNTDAVPYSLPIDSLKSIQIPLPPLSIQQQIVEILDTFTDSISNLQEELELREKQMEYYREKLLSFDKEEVEWKSIKDIGRIVRGNGLQKKDFTDEGVGCIHYGQIYTRFGLSTDKTLTFVESKLADKLTKVEPGNLVIACTSENIEDVCKSVVWQGTQTIVTGGHACVLKHHENPKYIGYCFTTYSFQSQKIKHAYGAKVIDIKTEKLGEIRIPVPSLSRQQEIVDILDTFESMIANIKEEIELRQKQYEYYREKLLTFERKEA